MPKIRSHADWLNATSLMTSSGISLPCFETRPAVDHTFGRDHVLGREPTDEASRNQDEPDEDEGANSPQTPTSPRTARKTMSTRARIERIASLTIPDQ